jgi:hypothetical protein
MQPAHMAVGVGWTTEGVFRIQDKFSERRSSCWLEVLASRKRRTFKIERLRVMTEDAVVGLRVDGYISESLVVHFDLSSMLDINTQDSSFISQLGLPVS